MFPSLRLLPFFFCCGRICRGWKVGSTANVNTPWRSGSGRAHNTAWPRRSRRGQPPGQPAVFKSRNAFPPCILVDVRFAGAAVFWHFLPRPAIFLPPARNPAMGTQTATAQQQGRTLQYARCILPRNSACTLPKTPAGETRSSYLFGTPSSAAKNPRVPLPSRRPGFPFLAWEVLL